MANDTQRRRLAAVADSPVLRVFGGIGVVDHDGPVSIGGPRQRRLLALLTIRSGSTVSIEWIAEHLWSDDQRPVKATAAVRTYMSRLRLALPESAQAWIETEPAGYRLDAPHNAVEHTVFVQLRADATAARGRGDALAAHGLLNEALELWRGGPFVELEDLDFAWAEIQQLTLDRLEMLEERWEAALTLGRHTQIVGELAVFTNEHRMRDRATRQYALALYRSGRAPEALRVIADHRRLLAGESGLDPSPELADLESSILNHDASLDVENVGRPLRGYRLLDEIGAGAFSIVWRGMQPSVGREVAIKQIRAELASQPEFIRRFEAEAHLVARIEHPHIVPLVDYWRDPDSAYLVMRYLRGGTLERRLDDGEFTLEATLTLARQIGGALTAAHGQGIVHRDVKSGNILFDEVGNAYLADFGIALEETRSAGPEAALSPGSPAYASPEQIKRLRLGAEADVFSLGVVLFECLAGSLPFADSSSVEQLLDRQLHVPYPVLSELRADVPPHISAAIAKATAKEPGDRWPSVDAFLAALEADLARSVISPAGALLAADDATNPYKGLLAFDDADIENFFGRERLVADLVNRLGGGSIQSRSLLVVGPSGSGKSSVVRAGLIPAIRSGVIPTAANWFITTMVPGADPYESLEAALLRVAVNPPTSLLSQLEDGERGIVRATRRCLTADDQRVLLVIDQFEEIFTNTNPERANQFLAALAAAVEDPTSPVLLVATLRADYYHRPLAHPTFARVVRDTAVDVTPLAPDELERAIVEPARRYGIEFEPGLPAMIAAECLGQAAPLPLLQYALAELFQQRDGDWLTADAYAEVGGLAGALAARAESLYEAAPEPDRAAIRRLFGRLANPAEHTGGLRRRLVLSDLATDPAAQAALESFGSARLITFDREVATREPTVEVAHEALFREWPRLAHWLDEDADMLRSVEAVANAATTWDAGGRAPADLYRGGRLEAAVDLAVDAAERLRELDSDFIEASRVATDAQRAAERDTVRRLRRLVVAVGAGLVLALVAGGIAFWQQRDATAQARRAEAQTELAVAAAERAEVANLASESAARAADNPELSLLLALEVHRRAPTAEAEQVVLNALASSALPNRLSTLPPPAGLGESACDVLVDPAVPQELATSDGELTSRNLLTGETSTHGPAPELPCVNWFGTQLENGRSALSTDGLRWWFATWDGPWSMTFESDTPLFPIVGTARQVLVLSPGVGQGEVERLAVLDVDRGGFRGEPIETREELGSGARNASGSLFAVSLGAPDQIDPGAILVIEASTGLVLHRVATDSAVTAMAFDDATNELVVNVSPRTLLSIDLATGQIVSRVEVASGARVLDLAVRPDGRVMIVTTAGVEWIDRASGQADVPLDIPGLSYASIRADGTLVGADRGDGTIGVIDVEGSALVDRVLPIDPFDVTTFNRGYAATIPVNRDSNEVDVLNLGTGERSVTALVTRNGDPFLPVAVSPEPDGILALDRNNVFARWVGSDEVARIELDGEPVTVRRMGDRLAHLSVRSNGSQVVDLLTLDEGIESLFTVNAPDAQVGHPSAAGGLHILDADGRLHTYDSDGALTSEITTAAAFAQAIVVDPTTGVLAISTGERLGDDRVILIDPATSQVTTLPIGAGVTSLGFARRGELLALTAEDGTTQLWDLERNAPGGFIWRDPGSDNAISSWYDDASGSLWLASGGKLARIPLDPQSWIDRACDLAGRDLTQAEWDRYVPGGGTVESACAR